MPSYQDIPQDQRGLGSDRRVCSKRNTMVLSVLLVLVTAALSTSASAQLTKETCFAAFLRLGFNATDYARFPVYFDDYSTVTLSEAGKYKGAQEIEEYLRFEEPYVKTKKGIGRVIAEKSFDAGANTCTAIALNAITLSTDPLYAYPARFTRIAMLSFTFSYAKNKIIAIGIYYPKPYLRFLFGRLLGAPQTARYVCSTLRNSCSAIHRLNGSPSLDECQARMEKLPIVSTGSYFDGNDRGCRALHASFAAEYPHHCPHISFVPVGDAAGGIKCQFSDVLAPLELFDAADLTRLEAYSKRMSINPRKGYTLDCLDSAGWSSGASAVEDCAWVAKDPQTRCALPGAILSCAATCNTECAKCLASSTNSSACAV